MAISDLVQDDYSIIKQCLEAQVVMINKSKPYMKKAHKDLSDISIGRMKEIIAKIIDEPKPVIVMMEGKTGDGMSSKAIHMAEEMGKRL